MKTLGQRVAYARASNDWSQSGLAREIGVKPQAIQQIESGETKKSRYLADIARVTGFRLEWIERGEGPHRQTEGTTLPDHIIEFAKALAKASPEQLQTVLEVLGMTEPPVKPSSNLSEPSYVLERRGPGLESTRKRSRGQKAEK